MQKKNEEEPRTETLPSLDQFLAEQMANRQIIEAAKTVGFLSSYYMFNRDGILIRQSLINGALQQPFWTALHKRIMFQQHCSKAVDPPQERRMYYTMGQNATGCMKQRTFKLRSNNVNNTRETLPKHDSTETRAVLTDQISAGGGVGYTRLLTKTTDRNPNL